MFSCNGGGVGADCKTSAEPFYSLHGRKWLIYWKEGRRTRQRNGTDTLRGCRLCTEGEERGVGEEGWWWWWWWGGGEKKKKGRLREAETRATEERLMEMSDRLSEWFTTGGAAAEPALDGWSWKTETNHKSCLWIIDRDKGGGEKAMALTFILPIMYIDELHYGALIKKWTRVFSLSQLPPPHTPNRPPPPPPPLPPPPAGSSIPLFSIAISMVIKDAVSAAPVP